MSQKTSPKRERPARGFTLVEIMIVVAIIGVLAALTLAAYDSVGRRGALQNAALDLQGVLSAARARAMARGFPVWVVFYPQASRAAPGSRTGRGAWLQVDDASSQYLASPNLLFALAFSVPSPVAVEAAGGGVTAVSYIEDYGKNVYFAPLPLPDGSVHYSDPFAALAVKACTFCTDSPSLRGALVFNADGSARFVDGQGAYLKPPNQGLALSSQDPNRQYRFQDSNNQYLFAISGPSAHITSFSP